MEVIRQDDGSRGRYSVQLEDGVEAELTYTHRGKDLVSADHTGVPPEAEGKGVGVAMVQRMVEDARAEGWVIDPRCPFVRAQGRRHPEWQDVIKG